MTAATKTIVATAIRADGTMTNSEKNRLVNALTHPSQCDTLTRLAYREEQAAEILGVSKKTIQRMKRKGDLRVCRVGNTNRITAESVNAIFK